MSCCPTINIFIESPETSRCSGDDPCVLSSPLTQVSQVKDIDALLASRFKHPSQCKAVYNNALQVLSLV